MRRRAVLITLAACGAAIAAAIGVAVTRQSSGPDAGGYRHGRLEVGGDIYRYAMYIPAGRRVGSVAPLVVVLHGCNMTADQQAAASGYDAIAEQHRFVVLYPDVDAVDELHGRCWRGIWDPSAEGRDRGDVGAIADITRAVIARWHIDRGRVYAIGISAGAFETSILGADYPDLYAAIGVHSGAPYMAGEFGCLAASQSPSETSALAHSALAAMGPRARVMPVIVFHGDNDNTVPYQCGQQTVAQWLLTDDLILHRQGRAALPSTPTSSQAVVPGGRAYAVASYADRLGCPVAQLWTIHGMGHYWSGGSAALASARFSDPQGPSAATGSWAFFSRWRLSGPMASCARRGR